MANSDDNKWPPVPGDYEVGNPNSSVAICTLGKKIMVDTDFAIIGTCKTENIGIERIVANTISNPHIRFLILAGPEVPGHKTGSSISNLHKNGVDEQTRKIIDAPGAIPYIENIPIEAVERFREQIDLIDMTNVYDPLSIAQTAQELLGKKTEPYPDGAMWIDFSTEAASEVRAVGGDVSVIPEYRLTLDPYTSLIAPELAGAIVATHPSRIAVEVRESEKGTILIGKEM